MDQAFLDQEPVSIRHRRVYPLLLHGWGPKAHRFANTTFAAQCQIVVLRFLRLSKPRNALEKCAVDEVSEPGKCSPHKGEVNAARSLVLRERPRSTRVPERPRERYGADHAGRERQRGNPDEVGAHRPDRIPKQKGLP